MQPTHKFGDIRELLRTHEGNGQRLKTLLHIYCMKSATIHNEQFRKLLVHLMIKIKKLNAGKSIRNAVNEALWVYICIFITCMERNGEHGTMRECNKTEAVI